MIPDNVLAQIVSANDIVETISAYVPLKKAGKDYKALCPFHSEKTPSFTVSPVKQIFYCFGCSAGGDVIGFVMKVERLEFPEAVELLARKKGIDLGAYQKSQGSAGAAGQSGIGKNRLFEINAAARAFFQANLKANVAPQEYLKKRGITGITARDFSLGWALPGWDTLLRWGLQQGFSKKELVAAGLVIQKEEDSAQHYDRFRARVMFPLFDTQDREIAFSGRVIEDALPKYINSPETVAFHKGSFLFGLNMAKDAIVKVGWAVVCEGPMDMIGVYQAGFQNIVASQGTAFTERHAKLLKRFTTRVILCFDGDQAGQKATLRSLDVFLGEGMEVKIAVLPSKEDPDSFVRSRGLDAFKTLLKSSSDFLTFRLNALKQSHDVTSQIGKSNAAREILDDLARLPGDVYQSGCIQRLSEFLGIREESLWLEFKKLKKSVTGERLGTELLSAPSVPPWVLDWVNTVIQNEGLLAREASEGHFQMLPDPLLIGIVQTAIAQHQAGNDRSIAAVSLAFHGSKEAEILAQIASRPLNQKESEGIYREGIVRLKKRQLENQIRELTVEIERQEREKGQTTALLTAVMDKKKELIHLTRASAGQ